ncbi:hypothetical protein VNO77_10584 [Canavalia gladiata]|uniref:Uncharacterized protein n=1 Tax=Canavalia gladiata TaxID=3824 RepID=A0AAN9MG07_CANGL
MAIPDWKSFRYCVPFHEVYGDLKQMKPATSPGPDGMSGLFYQKSWIIIGDDISFMAVDISKIKKPRTAGLIQQAEEGTIALRSGRLVLQANFIITPHDRIMEYIKRNDC